MLPRKTVGKLKGGIILGRFGDRNTLKQGESARQRISGGSE